MNDICLLSAGIGTSLVGLAIFIYAHVVKKKSRKRILRRD